MSVTSATAKPVTKPVATKDALVETVTQDLPTIGKGIAQGDAKKVGKGLVELTDDFVSGTVGRFGHFFGDLGKLFGVPGSKDLASWGADRWQNGGIIKKDIPAAVKEMDAAHERFKKNNPTDWERMNGGGIR